MSMAPDAALSPRRPAAGGPLVLRETSLELPPSRADGFAPDPEVVPADTRIFLTHLEGKPLSSQVAAARSLKAKGFRPVPHLGARYFANAPAFAAHVADLQAAGVHEALVVGGNPLRGQGAFGEAADLLRLPTLKKAGFDTIFIGGYPEGHPAIDDDTLTLALKQKLGLCAKYGLTPRLITQFAFDGEAIGHWITSKRESFPNLPIHVGLAGVTSLPKLIKFATICGIGPSLAALKRSGAGLMNLLSDRDPGDVIDAVERIIVNEHLIYLHFFPFGGWSKTTDWLQMKRSELKRLDHNE